MLYDKGYDIIELYSATKGMNQNIATNLLTTDYSYYIENIMPLSLGEGQVRYGNSLFSNIPTDIIIDGFPFSSSNGSKQQVLYFNGYNSFTTFTNLSITSANTIQLTSPNFALFQPDTYLKLQYSDNTESPIGFYEIKSVNNLGGNTINITLNDNSFADSLNGYYIDDPKTTLPQYIDNTHFSVTIPNGFVSTTNYFIGQKLQLTINQNLPLNLTIASLDLTVPNQITFTTSGDNINPFVNGDSVILSYQSHFFIDALNTSNPQYISGTSFSISTPEGFLPALCYVVGNFLKLTINGAVYNLRTASIDLTVPNQITFTTTGDVIPVFGGVDVVTLKYESLTPKIIALYNSVGYIKVLDVASNTLLSGGNQTLTNLSVACVPRAEYFANVLWIYNGVDPIMTWDGSELKIYEEQVKETANSFNWIGARNFSFLTDNTFDITKYQNGKSIRLVTIRANAILQNLITVVSAIAQVGNRVTITTSDDITEFTGQDTKTLFYFDRPPPFSYMKGALDRLWCLGAGAVGLNYRTPDLALKFYYSYKPFSDAVPFNFFNEKTKAVPSEDISAKHGCPDNLEAIVELSGNLVFMGRQKSQVWKGLDPNLNETSPNYFSWSTTLPVGIYHGSLIVELANDSQFLSQNGFVSFSTLNIARQFAASDTANMNKVASEYMNTIDSNIQYRACRSFKYKNGGFCGFKIGQNNLIVSRYHTSFFWWGIFSGDFASASSFLTTLDDSLYLFIDNKIYQYADGLSGSPVLYADSDGERSIDFVEIKYINNLKGRFANKRYEIQADYSSSVIINPENSVNIYIAGDLRNTFVLQDSYSMPLQGDVLGSIPLVDGNNSGPNPQFPLETAIGMRLDTASHTKKGRLKFLSNNFSVMIVGSLKNGPFSFTRIRLYGVVER